MPRRAGTIAGLLLLIGSCSLERSPLEGIECGTGAPCSDGARCIAGRCVAPLDAGIDAPSPDAPDAPPSPADAPLDLGLDGGACTDGVQSPGETDVDCGGGCPPCAACLRCAAASDCVGGAECSGGRCTAFLTSVELADGSTAPAYVRSDGAILLAHYAPGTYHRGYDPYVAQATTADGGATPGTGFAPDPCFASGHLDFDGFLPAGRVVELSCGTDLAPPRVTARSGTLFDAFSPGDHGTPGSAGEPGWANIAALGSGLGRSRHGSCGSTPSAETGGLAYCDGAPTPDYSNHVVSYTVSSGRSNVGCGGTGCSGSSCDLHVWVWLLPE